MKFDIKIDDAHPDFWEQMDNLGIVLYGAKDGIIYHYVSYETAIKILDNETLNYSLPINFNDPFDLSTGLLDTTMSEDRINKIVNGQFITTPEIRQRFIDFHKANPRVFPEVFIERLNGMKSEIGICCFSKSYCKTLMWSHYANKHAGICLGFAFDNVAGDGLMQLSVRYTDRIEPLNYFEESILSIYNWIFTKSKVWEYEEEVRRVYIDKNGLLPFKKTELVEIYYGVRLTEEQVKIIREKLNSRNFDNIKKEKLMKIDPSTFDLIEKSLDS